MGQLPKLKREDFALKKVKIMDGGLECSFTANLNVEGKSEKVDFDGVKASYIPHEDLIEFRDRLKIYLFNAFNLHKGFDIAERYLETGKLKKAKEAREEMMEKTQVTSVTIVGSDQLRGAKISGKVESYNETFCSISAPTITYSSENIGIEKDVEKIVDLIEIEVFKYIFEGKSGTKTLFDGDEGDDTGVRKMNTNTEGSVPVAKAAAGGLS